MTDYFIKKIKIKGNEQLFICRGNSHIVDADKLNEQFIFKNQKHATLFKVENRILKVCHAQSVPKDILRKYILNSQAEREFKSADIISQLGLISPESNFSAFSLSPFTMIESMHEMSFLDNFEDIGKDFIRKGDRRDSFGIISCFAKDLAIMTNEMFVPKDLGLGNIMYNRAEAKMAWLDTDLKKVKSKTQSAKMLMAQLTPRLFRHLSKQDTDLFWNVFCEHSTLFPDRHEMISRSER